MLGYCCWVTGRASDLLKEPPQQCFWLAVTWLHGGSMLALSWELCCCHRRDAPLKLDGKAMCITVTAFLTQHGNMLSAVRNSVVIGWLVNRKGISPVKVVSNICHNFVLMDCRNLRALVLYKYFATQLCFRGLPQPRVTCEKWDGSTKIICMFVCIIDKAE